MSGSPQTPRHPLSILLVEDSFDAATSLALLLELYGHDVTVVSHAEAAIQKCNTDRFDVIILDINLNGIMNGWQLAAYIRAQEHPLRRKILVAVTGYGTDDDKTNSYESGMDYHLTKPVEPALFQKLLNEISEKLVKRK
ncbi:hypothetical protein BH11PLA2_BH11PLA2_19660 [soil metagenome]